MPRLLCILSSLLVKDAFVLHLEALKYVYRCPGYCWCLVQISFTTRAANDLQMSLFPLRELSLAKGDPPWGDATSLFLPGAAMVSDWVTVMYKAGPLSQGGCVPWD